MSRLVDGIKQLLKGEDDEEDEEEERKYKSRYRTGYDRHQGPESVRYYNYPVSPSSGMRRGYYSPREEYRYGKDRSERRGEYEKSERSEYRKKSSRRGSKGKDDDSDDSDEEVVELMVPMCCDKCKEKVEEELSEVEGVKSVRCDQYNSRVTVIGSDIDTERCLVKAERAVKKKCELIGEQSDGSEGDSRERSGRRYYVREESGGRPSLGRLPSFAGGRPVYYDGRDYEEKDYNGFGRLPSFSRHRHHEAEYITAFNRRPEPLDYRRDNSGFGRMPSFNRHRHHDAEYITSADPRYAPRTFYDRDGGSSYTSAYYERPAYNSQTSFSRAPVGNPGYMKHMDY